VENLTTNSAQSQFRRTDVASKSVDSCTPAASRIHILHPERHVLNALSPAVRGLAAKYSRFDNEESEWEFYRDRAVKELEAKRRREMLAHGRKAKKARLTGAPYMQLVVRGEAEPEFTRRREIGRHLPADCIDPNQLAHGSSTLTEFEVAELRYLLEQRASRSSGAGDAA